MTSQAPALSPRSWMRLDGVDLLRALGIFFVLMNHVNMRLLGAKVPYTKGLPEQLVATLVWSGQYGVQIFFAVSGFLITGTALRRWGTPAQVQIADFYRLRFARIGPLLFALLAVLSLLHLGGVKHFVVSAATGGLPRALLAALTFHVNVLEARRGYLPANWDILWSLSVEEMFYLFFPLACRLFRRTRYMAVPLLLFVVLGPFARAKAFNPNPVWREYSYLGGMDAIALGCLTALLLAHVEIGPALRRAFAFAGTVLIGFVLCFTFKYYAWGLGRSGLDMTLLALGACMLIAVAAKSQWEAPGLLRPVLTMGRRSYEIYLTHMFVVFVAFDRFLAAGKPMTAVPTLFIVVIVLAVLAGELVARFYSEPLNRRLRAYWSEGPRELGSVVEHG